MTIADSLLNNGMTVLGFVDDNRVLAGQIALGFPILGIVRQWEHFEPSSLMIGIGSIAVHRTLTERLAASAS